MPTEAELTHQMKLMFFHIMQKFVHEDFLNAFLTDKGSKDGSSIFKSIPIRKLLGCGVLLVIFGLFVPVTQSSGNRIDSSIWVGTLTFEGAYAVGSMALADWFAKSIFLMFGGLLSEAIDMGIFKWNVEYGDFKEAFEKELQKDKGVSRARIASKLVFSGAFIILAIVVIMPLAIWLPAKWESGILVASVIWTVGSISNLGLLGIFTILRPLFEAYLEVSKYHNSRITECPICIKRGVISTESYGPYLPFNE
ncbi:hypothetical protein NZD89_14090 [Alicyclobacillus fastidiosus]|uniref:Uncharacterized protein n=1 Tax=Alicyclobacillus fastidiosus TaxID=392011 RepID=A0ABY6ZPA5_9BACL|nr:hypothetical protein [Alicyclobacillus fastidiosus]WAH44418.1 hypothetical protein NZD89_14090 [Alicyclobacillus fastidiosus]GMA60758.1 hypothetical protein GCM10025859_11980 [Alicyclobacillus fastidiosus]